MFIITAVYTGGEEGASGIPVPNPVSVVVQ